MDETVKQKIIDMAHLEYHMLQPGRPTLTITTIARELEADGWTVESGNEFIGSSGREVGPAGIRTSRGHVRYGKKLRAEKDGIVVEVGERTKNKVHQLCEQIAKAYGWSYR